MTAISFEGLVLTVACALGWSLLDFTRKLLAGSASAVATAFLLVTGQIPLFIAWAVIEGPPGSIEAGGAWLPASGYWWPGLLSVALNLLAHLAFMQSVKLAPISRTVPLLSLTPVFTTLVAIPIFAEWPTALQSLGIVAVVLASIVISWSGDGDPATDEAAARRGGLLMASVALLWSVTPSLDKLALGFTSAAVHALILVVGVSLGLALIAWRRGEWGEILRLFRDRRAMGLMAASVAIAAFSIGVQFLAYEHVSVGLVETIKRGIGAAFALFAGRLLLAEHIGWRRLVAAAVMIAGVAAVML